MCFSGQTGGRVLQKELRRQLVLSHLQGLFCVQAVERRQNSGTHRKSKTRRRPGQGNEMGREQGRSEEKEGQRDGSKVLKEGKGKGGTQPTSRKKTCPSLKEKA